MTRVTTDPEVAELARITCNTGTLLSRRHCHGRRDKKDSLSKELMSKDGMKRDHMDKFDMRTKNAMAKGGMKKGAMGRDAIGKVGSGRDKLKNKVTRTQCL